MTLADQIAYDNAVVFSSADFGEAAHYRRDDGPQIATRVTFRPLTVNDLVSEHVIADDSICEIVESDFDDFLFTVPQRGDVVIRNLWTANEEWEVVEIRHNVMAGLYTLVVRKNARLIP